MTARLSAAFDRSSLRALDPAQMTPAIFHPALADLCGESGGLLARRVAGKSFEGRPIHAVAAGTGPVRILLWSQMHGDESTATRALGDLLRHLSLTRDEPATARILASTSLLLLPMLNPDGAERLARRNAQGIDVNRDALALRTPEGRLLMETADRFRPEVSFNLHDQELSTAGYSREITAMAFLAPAFDAARSESGSRALARRVAAAAAGIASALAPGRVARYDDGFEPRAFGDVFQGKGYGTVLFESGHAKGDPAKMGIRRMTFAAILGALEAIAGGGVRDAATAPYDGLPPNGRRAYDVVVRNAAVRSPAGEYAIDLGISRQVDTHSEGPPRLVDAGDLGVFTGLEEVNGSGIVLRPEDVVLDAPFDLGRFTGG